MLRNVNHKTHYWLKQCNNSQGVIQDHIAQYKSQGAISTYKRQNCFTGRNVLSYCAIWNHMQYYSIEHNLRLYYALWNQINLTLTSHHKIQISWERSIIFFFKLKFENLLSVEGYNMAKIGFWQRNLNEDRDLPKSKEGRGWGGWVDSKDTKDGSPRPLTLSYNVLLWK